MDVLHQGIVNQTKMTFVLQCQQISLSVNSRLVSTRSVVKEIIFTYIVLVLSS